eukprot:scaffold44_cov411-Prasinococcus_capsulatus_cf.AAC.45
MAAPPTPDQLPPRCVLLCSATWRPTGKVSGGLDRNWNEKKSVVPTRGWEPPRGTTDYSRVSYTPCMSEQTGRSCTTGRLATCKTAMLLPVVGVAVPAKVPASSLLPQEIGNEQDALANQAHREGKDLREIFGEPPCELHMVFVLFHLQDLLGNAHAELLNHHVCRAVAGDQRSFL